MDPYQPDQKYLKSVFPGDLCLVCISLSTGEALDCLVSIQTRLGEDDRDILAKLKRILSIQEKEMGYESEEVMTTLKKVVYYLDKMGKKEEKLPLQRRLSLLRTKYKHKVPV